MLDGHVVNYLRLVLLNTVVDLLVVVDSVLDRFVLVLKYSGELGVGLVVIYLKC